MGSLRLSELHPGTQQHRDCQSWPVPRAGNEEEYVRRELPSMPFSCPQEEDMHWRPLLRSSLRPQGRVSVLPCLHLEPLQDGLSVVRLSPRCQSSWLKYIHIPYLCNSYAQHPFYNLPGVSYTLNPLSAFSPCYLKLLLILLTVTSCPAA